ncbi:hypothetical protein DL237_06470 [Pseudooceanicola sediminis]|uniref:Uncharacterized protein n=1 Tax=Pseudooceanicola sediminis TaxID=2211117 RepID=A0A399J717_9RHOB|nr:hypothetical protein DL237_06470 [Pseudooceanicola sediminis]
MMRGERIRAQHGRCSGTPGSKAGGARESRVRAGGMRQEPRPGDDACGRVPLDAGAAQPGREHAQPMTRGEWIRAQLGRGAGTPCSKAGGAGVLRVRAGGMRQEPGPEDDACGRVSPDVGAAQPGCEHAQPMTRGERIGVQLGRGAGTPCSKAGGAGVLRVRAGGIRDEAGAA